MDLIEIMVLLFIVVDPFGNIPFILALLKNSEAAEFRKTVLREVFIAYLILLAFFFQGNLILRYLGINEASISVAGGIILFLISIHMIFKGSGDVFTDEYGENPIFVPIAMPYMAGPSAIATVMLIHSRLDSQWHIGFLALTLVMTINAILFVLSRRIGNILGRRGLKALDRLMGMLLNLISVNMILRGIHAFLSSNAS